MNTFRINRITLIIGLLFSSCSIENQMDDNNFKYPDCSNVEKRMYQVLEKSLKKQYGTADAYDRLQGDIEKHYFFILEVDRKAVRKINQTLYASGLFYYFYDENEFRHKTEVRNFRTPRMFEELSMDRESFLIKELAESESAVIEEIVSSHKIVGATSPTVIDEILRSHHVKPGQDEMLKRFLGVYFWPYLCFCANIDITSGEAK